jgi:hypothetical protein
MLTQGLVACTGWVFPCRRQDGEAWPPWAGVTSCRQVKRTVGPAFVSIRMRAALPARRAPAACGRKRENREGTVLALAAEIDKQAKGDAKAGLEPLSRLVGDDLEAVNRLIVEHMHSPVALIPQLASHIVAAGGKRLRPMLTLAAARLCGYEGVRHIGLAACVEFIHTATLLHDDVVDASDLRRGLATATNHTLIQNLQVSPCCFLQCFHQVLRLQEKHYPLTNISFGIA